MSNYRIEGRPKTIYRVVKNKQNPYVMIDRRPIDNKALSFKAKGILTYLMSRPDGWEVSVTDMVNHGTDGDDSIRSGLKELIEAGHIKQTRTRDKGRITGWMIEVYELPYADFQDMENPDMENPDVENPTQVISNKAINKKIVSRGRKEVVVVSSSSPPPSGENISLQRIRELSKGEILENWNSQVKKELTSYPLEWIEDAIRIAVLANKRNWKYILGILANWREEGTHPLEDHKA